MKQYANRKAQSPGFLNRCIKRKDFKEAFAVVKISPRLFGIKSILFKLWQPSFRCFALNFVEAQDGMLLLSFLEENRGFILMVFLKEKMKHWLSRYLNTVMLGKFIASSAPRQTQQIIMSVYDDQVEGGNRCTI